VPGNTSCAQLLQKVSLRETIASSFLACPKIEA